MDATMFAADAQDRASTPCSAPNAALPRLEQQACFALYSASLAMNRLYRRLLEPFNLTYPQYLVMMVLWEKQGLSVNAIGDRLFLDSATLTPLLKRLEQMGLIIRKRAVHDERLREIDLTEAGRSLQVQAADIPNRVQSILGYESDDLNHLKMTLELVRNQVLHQLPNH